MLLRLIMWFGDREHISEADGSLSCGFRFPHPQTLEFNHWLPALHRNLFKSLGSEKQLEKSPLVAHLSKHIHIAFLMLFAFVLPTCSFEISVFLCPDEVGWGKLTLQPSERYPISNSQNLLVFSSIRNWGWLLILFKLFFLLLTWSFLLTL